MVIQGKPSEWEDALIESQRISQRMLEKISQVREKTQAQVQVQNSKSCDKKQGNSINFMFLDYSRERKKCLGLLIQVGASSYKVLLPN